jgi:hypothetical protein
MFGVVMFGVPFAIQLFAWAAGSPDDDDSPFIWNNETGRKLYANMTPLMKRFGYEGGVTGERKIYLHFGKQAYEVINGWLESPLRTIQRKASLPVRLVFEQMTGSSLGADWDLGFKNEGLAGLLKDKDGRFRGSRAAHFGSSFMPFSLRAISGKDAGALPIFGPVNKGMSMYTATTSFEHLLRAWADPDMYTKNIYGNRRVTASLYQLAPDILDAAARNGYDPEKVISGARGAVLKDIYIRLYEALNSGNDKELEKWARAVMRVNGAIDDVRASIRNKDGMYGRVGPRTQEQKDALRQAFGRQPFGK